MVQLILQSGGEAAFKKLKMKIQYEVALRNQKII